MYRKATKPNREWLYGHAIHYISLWATRAHRGCCGIEFFLQARWTRRNHPVKISSQVGRTWACNRCPPCALPSRLPTTAWAWPWG